NPWEARTLEWATPTPPPSYAFASLPEVTDRADRTEVDAVATMLAAGDGYLGHARNGWQEVLGVEMSSGRPDALIVLPRRTYKPLISGLLTGAFFLCLLFKLYWLSLPVLALAIASLLAWSAGTGSTRDLGEMPIGRGEQAPTHWETDRPPSWWA